MLIVELALVLTKARVEAAGARDAFLLRVGASKKPTTCELVNGSGR